MAFPMVTLSIVTLLATVIPMRWPLWLSPNNPLTNQDTFIVHWSIPLLIFSGICGCAIGSLMVLRRALARSTQLSLRFFQDLFAYDFYLEEIYAKTIVAAIAGLSRLTAWFDRYVIDGAVNLVSLATIFSGSALKYNTSGQSQFYVLTIVVGVGLLMWLILSGQWSIIGHFWSSLISPA
jgi:NAD(P)H-quinone oxidoreductase subunit 5